MDSKDPGWRPPGSPQNNFSPGQAVVPTSTVEISIYCSQLEDMDVFSKSDPFCVLYVKDSKSKQWHCFGKTETIDNTLEPHFEKKFILTYKGAVLKCPLPIRSNSEDPKNLGWC